jgi:3-oxoacyl-[acyl-carrier protein] reductase
MSTIKLDGTVCVVTGGGNGLGKSMAMALAAAGGRVVLAAPEQALITETATEIEKRRGKGRALPVVTDITSRASCENMIAETKRAFGTIHVLVNNARRAHRGPGLPARGNALPFYESNPDIWQETIHVNVNGTFLVSHLVAPILMAQKWGRIVNITTSIGTMQRRRNSPYGVTKAALEAATLIWAQDLAGTGVTVNSLIPGGHVHTDLRYPVEPGRNPLPVDIMDEAIVWLASPLSDGATGRRYVGKFWNKALPSNEAAAGALEPPVLRPADE